MLVGGLAGAYFWAVSFFFWACSCRELLLLVIAVGGVGQIRSFRAPGFHGGGHISNSRFLFHFRWVVFGLVRFCVFEWF